jgi:ubiquinone/menaquinone biosynthesis C-methylase UbiE
MSEKVFNGKAEKLRSPQRRELLQVSRVVAYCLSGIDPKSVLDIGTGTGLFAEAFLEAGLRVKGIDCNEDFVKLASEAVPGAEFRFALAEKLPFDNASFDLVFMGHVLHESKDILVSLKEAHRVLRKRLAILEWPYCEQENGPPLEHRISADQVLIAAGQAGFSNADIISMKVMQLYILDSKKS